MKRYVVFVFVIAALMIQWANASAQEAKYMRRPHLVDFGVDGGMAFPAKPGTFKDLWDTGWPLSADLGIAVFSWLEVGGGLNYSAFGITEIPAKKAIGREGTQEITGGKISVTSYYGRVRFLGVPNARINPYAEFSLGIFKTKADNLVSAEGSSGGVPVPSLVNSMPDVTGIHFSGGGGLQYALNEHWSSYVKFIWTVNHSSDFKPGDLVQGDTPQDVQGGDMQYGAIIVGMLFRM